MVKITGLKRMTLDAIAGEIYQITFGAPGYVCVYNVTKEELLIGDTGEFQNVDGVGNYVTMPSNSAISDYRHGGEIYIKAIQSGKVVVAKS